MLTCRGSAVCAVRHAIPSTWDGEMLVRGIRTEHIMSPTRRQVHTLTPFAKVRRSTLTYPSESFRAVEKKPLAKRSRSSQPTTTPHGGRDLSLANKRREVLKRKRLCT